jgi:hypothetical protein
MTLARWTEGYTRAELDNFQHRYGLVFPPDLVELLGRKRPAEGHDWKDDASIRRALDWPLNGLLMSVERGQIWWPEWGQEPRSASARKQVVREAVSYAPKLIPLIAHRYLPEQPHESGNPVFSIFYTDAVYYGANLKDYFEREFGDYQARNRPWPSPIRRIPFWSDLVERFGQHPGRSA